MKYIEEVTLIANQAVAAVRGWLSSVGLQLADLKTEALLVSSRKQMKTITVTVGRNEISSQPYLKYQSLHRCAAVVQHSYGAYQRQCIWDRGPVIAPYAKHRKTQSKPQKASSDCHTLDSLWSSSLERCNAHRILQETDDISVSQELIKSSKFVSGGILRIIVCDVIYT